MTGIGISLPLFITGKRLRAYLDDIGTLPYLDIHMVREKREKGEPISIEKNSEREPAEETAEETTEVKTEATTEETTHAERAHVRDRHALSSSARRNIKITVYAVAALFIMLLVVLLVRNKGAISQMYYAKKLERAGVTYSDQAFLNAVSTNNEETVNAFNRAGMKLDVKNAQGQTALIITAEKGNVQILARLLQLDAGLLRQYDASGNSELMTAARQGQGAVVQVLIERGADVNYSVPLGEGAASALQAAVDAPDFKKAHMNIISQLLHHGADVKGRNSAGRSSLFFAAAHGRLEAASLPIENGAEVNEADLKGADLAMTSPDGQTPLMCACQGGHGETVSPLLTKGSNINAKTASGATALTETTRTGDIVMTQLLLARGADHASGYVPGTFKTLQGRVAVVNAKKVKKIGDMLAILSKTAFQDGYTITYDVNKMGQNTTMRSQKSPWNKLLNDVAAKNRFVLVVKDKSVTILP